MTVQICRGDLQWNKQPNYNCYASVLMLSRSVLSDSATLWTVVCQSPLFMGFFRQEILEWVAISTSKLVCLHCPFPSSSQASLDWSRAQLAGLCTCSKKGVPIPPLECPEGMAFPTRLKPCLCQLRLPSESISNPGAFQGIHWNAMKVV